VGTNEQRVRIKVRRCADQKRSAVREDDVVRATLGKPTGLAFAVRENSINSIEAD